MARIVSPGSRNFFASISCLSATPVINFQSGPSGVRNCLIRLVEKATDPVFWDTPGQLSLHRMWLKAAQVNSELVATGLGFHHGMRSRQGVHRSTQHDSWIAPPHGLRAVEGQSRRLQADESAV